MSNSNNPPTQLQMSENFFEAARQLQSNCKHCGKFIGIGSHSIFDGQFVCPTCAELLKTGIQPKWRLDWATLAIETIRKWYLTICHDLCIPVIDIKITAKPIEMQYGSMAGQFNPRDPVTGRPTVTIAIIPSYKETDYLFILAHELYHAHEAFNNKPQLEKKCNDYAKRFIKRVKTPTVNRYAGPIAEVKTE